MAQPSAFCYRGVSSVRLLRRDFRGDAMGGSGGGTDGRSIFFTLSSGDPKYNKTTL